MGMISVRLNVEDTRIIKAYAKAKNMTISELVRDKVLERIQDEIDLKLHHASRAAHHKQSKSITFDDMMNELDSE